jgi:outer membrane protein
MRAQQKKWTLEECVAYALENNISIQQSELDLKVSDVLKMEAWDKYRSQH